MENFSLISLPSITFFYRIMSSATRKNLVQYSSLSNGNLLVLSSNNFK